MATITATSISIAQAQIGMPALVYIVSSSAAVYFFNGNTSVWVPVPMVTT